MNIKKLTPFFLLVLFGLVFSSCSSSETTEPADQNDDPTTSTFYITYKMDGVEISSKLIAAGRATNVDPNVLNITGAAAGATHPTVVISTEKSVIGFVPGLNVKCNDNSFPVHFASFTDSNGDQYSTLDNADGIDVFFSKLSYVEDGEVEGQFSGTVEDIAGNTIAITEGKFKLKFED
jgi:hypothetical protein